MILKKLKLRDAGIYGCEVRDMDSSTLLLSRNVTVIVVRNESDKEALMNQTQKVKGNNNNNSRSTTSSSSSLVRSATKNSTNAATSSTIQPATSSTEEYSSYASDEYYYESEEEITQAKQDELVSCTNIEPKLTKENETYLCLQLKNGKPMTHYLVRSAGTTVQLYCNAKGI